MTAAPDRVPVNPPPPYATFIPVRGYDFRHQFKPHNTLGQAKNAVLNKHYNTGGFECDMTIYELVGDHYIPWLHVTEGTSREQYPELAPRPPSKRQEQYRLKWAEQVAASYQEQANEYAAKAAALRAELEEKK